MGNGTKVMLVEDNGITQATIKRDLEKVGVEVLVAPSAEDAWQLLENGPIPPIMILDFHLPGQDGPEFYYRLSVDPRFENIVVIPFTALIDRMDSESISTVGDFVQARGAMDGRILPIVSKRGREDVSQTPPLLYVFIAHALQRQGLERSESLRSKVREILGHMTEEGELR